MSEKFSSYPQDPLRKATTDMLHAASRKHMIHGLLEVPIGALRSNLREQWKATGERICLNTYIVHAFARAVASELSVQSYRDWRGRIIIFDHVDVSLTVERFIHGRSVVVPVVIRSAHLKSLTELEQEIQTSRSQPLEQESQVFKMMRAFTRVPGPVRRRLFRLLERFPKQLKKRVGTVMVSSVGMHTQSAGWGIPVATHTINLTVGSVYKKPVSSNGNLESIDHVCLTISADHDVVDGAPLARFSRRFMRLLEHPIGIETRSKTL